MTLAEELLNSLSDDKVMLLTAEPETEGHIVIGADRFITVPDELKRIAVQHDHNIETVTFDCPRYWDDTDMSAMRIYINYVRADKAPGCYAAKNVTVDETDSSIMHFDWTISRNVTDVAGNITFQVCTKDTDEEGNEEEHWNSELCKDCYVSPGLDCGIDDLNEQYPDVLNQWEERVDSAIEKLTESVDTKTTEMVDKVNTAIEDLTTTVNNKNAELSQNVDNAIENLTTTVEDTVAKANETVENTTNELLAARDAGEFNGATFTPDLSEEGDLSWSNDKGLENPTTVNIKGPAGFSPLVSISEIEGGRRITIIDAEGVKTFDVMDAKECGFAEFMKNYMVIGETEPSSGPVLWFDTSARVSSEDIIILELGSDGEDTPVLATVDGEDYPVLNISEPIEIDGNTYELVVT